MPMASSKTGGICDVYSKGKQAYGIAQAMYGAYQTGSQVYRIVRPFQLVEMQKKKGLTPLELARRLSANLHAVREHKPPRSNYGVHHGYRKR